MTVLLYQGYFQYMKISKKRIGLAVLLTAVAFILVSFLQGDKGYIENLSTSLLIRSGASSVNKILNEQANPSVRFSYHGEDKLKGVVQKELIEKYNVNVVGKSEYLLDVNLSNGDGSLSSSIILSSQAGELVNESNAITIGDWTSLLPPILAIILAICLRRVLLSLSLAIWLGAAIHFSFNPIKSAWYALSNYIWGNFMGEFSLTILGFVFVLVGMVNIINRGGGMAGVVNQITKIAKCAKTACLSAACMGTVIFFDDYTNTIVVGTTMRSFTDKMKVSREKLAYIVDSTSAPLAGLAVLSTWIGFEVMQIQGVADFLGIPESGYSLFLKALPYRFYCIFTIAFVFMVSLFRRDFGPMLKAERRAFQKNMVHEPDTEQIEDSMIKAADPKENIPMRWYNAAIPVFFGYRVSSCRYFMAWLVSCDTKWNAVWIKL